MPTSMQSTTTRAIRICSIAVVLLSLGATAADAQAPLRRQPNAREKQKLINQIAAAGLNCPLLDVIDNAGEDSRGKMIRIHCVSLSGAAHWDVRGIAAPHSTDLRFESW